MKIATVILLLILVTIFAKSRFFSFHAQSPQDYAGTGPQFILTQHLAGPIISEGLVFGPAGRVTTSFVAEMNGQWDGNTGTLTEHFVFSNGQIRDRKWYLTIGNGNTFMATADDIVGEAKGIVSGSTVQLKYEIILPEEAGGQRLKATDWLYLAENGAILNRSELRKFGVKVAELVATMRPATAQN